jgi:hypothetical protein
MNDELDELLGSDLVQVPDGFSARVMSHINALPARASTTRATDVQNRFQWLALIGAGLVGVTQLAAFMFGIWFAGTAG